MVVPRIEVDDTTFSNHAALMLRYRSQRLENERNIRMIHPEKEGAYDVVCYLGGQAMGKRWWDHGGWRFGSHYRDDHIAFFIDHVDDDRTAETRPFPSGRPEGDQDARGPVLLDVMVEQILPGAKQVAEERGYECGKIYFVGASAEGAWALFAALARSDIIHGAAGISPTEEYLGRRFYRFLRRSSVPANRPFYIDGSDVEEIGKLRGGVRPIQRLHDALDQKGLQVNENIFKPNRPHQDDEWGLELPPMWEFFGIGAPKYT